MTPDSSEARGAILERIAPRSGSAKSNAARSTDYASIPRNYARTAERDLENRLALLEHRLREYDATVYRTNPGELPATIARILSLRGKSRIVIPPGIPPEWLPLRFSFLAAEGLSAVELDRVDGVLTGCTLAIAVTGTLVLQNAAGQGARRLSLVPDYHLCVVSAAQVVETVPEAFDALAGTKNLPLTFISGPSATADIEMTRIKGVHGPRTLDVILTSDSSS